MRASVGLSSALWKTADRIQMPFGIIGRMGPGIRQVIGFGDRSTRRGTFGANLGRAIVSNGDFTAYVCDSASTVGAAVSSVAWGGPRHCCMEVDVVQGKEQVLMVYVLHFHNGKCHWVADDEVFPIRMRKLHNISVRQTYGWKAR